MKRVLRESLALAIFVIPGFATSVVFVRTPDHIVVAADSLWLASSDWKRYFPYIACKIARVGHIYFTVSTVDTDAMQVQELARKSIAQSASVIQAAKNFRVMVDQIAQRTAAHEIQSNLDMCQRKICTEIVFFGIEQRVPVIAEVKLEQVGKSRESLKLVPHEYLCPGNCDKRGKTAWAIGRRDRINRKGKADPDFARRNDEDSARHLVELEEIAEPQYVGGPIDVLMLDSTGAHWMPADGGTCSSDEATGRQTNWLPPDSGRGALEFVLRR